VYKRHQYEKENVIDKYPEIAEKMKSDFTEWLKSVENSQKGGDYSNIVEQ
jgi:hypothetical protein